MRIKLSKKSSSGYTIIELIFSIMILVIVFTVAQANYRQYIFNKNLDSVKSNIVSDLRLAQESALSGKKSTTCSVLNGYTFTLNAASGATSYSIRASCGATTELIKTVVLSDLSANVTANYSGNTGTANGILFKVLGGGNDIRSSNTNVVITLSQKTTNYSRIITISPGGEIK